MKIVISISEKDYELACKFPDECLIAVYAHAIKNGTPLPSEHGRLIDISPYEKHEKNCDPWVLRRYVGRHIREQETLNLAEIPTVIEAESEKHKL